MVTNKKSNLAMKYYNSYNEWKHSSWKLNKLEMKKKPETIIIDDDSDIEGEKDHCYEGFMAKIDKRTLRVYEKVNEAMIRNGKSHRARTALGGIAVCFNQ